jgi:hypothetical protein
MEPLPSLLSSGYRKILIEEKGGVDVKLTAHLCPVQGLGMNGAERALPPYVIIWCLVSTTEKFPFQHTVLLNDICC